MVADAVLTCEGRSHAGHYRGGANASHESLEALLIDVLIFEVLVQQEMQFTLINDFIVLDCCKSRECHSARWYPVKKIRC